MATPTHWRSINWQNHFEKHLKVSTKFEEKHILSNEFYPQKFYEKYFSNSKIFTFLSLRLKIKQGSPVSSLYSILSI